MPHSSATTDFYIRSTFDSESRLYTDGAGSNEGDRTDSVDQLTFEAGDTLSFGGSGTFYYANTYYPGTWDSRTVYDYYLNVDSHVCVLQSDSWCSLVSTTLLSRSYHSFLSVRCRWDHDGAIA